MATETVHVSDIIPATAAQVYKAFLDGDDHTAMTGAGATCDARVGGKFTAWDGYAEGKNLELTPGKRIVQAWRTSEFPTKSADSRLIVLLDKADGGTRVTFVHTDIPEGQGQDYEQGWKDYYLKPMKKFFAQSTKKKTAAKTRKAPK